MQLAWLEGKSLTLSTTSGNEVRPHVCAWAFCPVVHMAFFDM